MTSLADLISHFLLKRPLFRWLGPLIIPTTANYLYTTHKNMCIHTVMYSWNIANRLYNPINQSMILKVTSYWLYIRAHIHSTFLSIYFSLSQIAQLLLKHGADITLRNYEGQTAVQVASSTFRTMLLDSVEHTSDSPHRILLQAAWQGNIKVLRKLLVSILYYSMKCMT